MPRRLKGALALAFVLAGCAQIEVRNADAGPGGTVTTEDHTRNALLGWVPRVTPRNRPGIDHWTRIRVIAPEGATECRSGSLFARGGPSDRGKPDKDRAVMLTVREGDRTAHFVCDTPGGQVKRSVEASVFERPSRPNGKAFGKFHVLPPLVHMNPRDPDAEARWAAIVSEVCPVISERAATLPCHPGMMEKFKAVDLARGS